MFLEGSRGGQTQSRTRHGLPPLLPPCQAPRTKGRLKVKVAHSTRKYVTPHARRADPAVVLPISGENGCISLVSGPPRLQFCIFLLNLTHQSLFRRRGLLWPKPCSRPRFKHESTAGLHGISPHSDFAIAARPAWAHFSSSGPDGVPLTPMAPTNLLRLVIGKPPPKTTNPGAVRIPGCDLAASPRAPDGA